MTQHKVVILGLENDELEHERHEMADLDVEFVQAKPDSDGEAMELVRYADAVMLRGNWGRTSIINATTKCKVMAVYSHGFNHVDVDAINDKNIILTNGPGMCAEEVSDQAVAFILALNRSVVQTSNDMSNGTWDGSRYRPITPLDQSTLGIVGFGNIGRRLARKMAGWRMHMLTYDPYIPPWITEEYAVEHVHNLDEVFIRSDYVVVVVPLNKETHHFINKRHFDLMQPSAYFINVCRGAVVNEQALITALNEKRLRGAGLDVFEQEPTPSDNPLLQMRNVITAPHIAGASTRSDWLSRQRASQQVAAVLRGEWPQAVQNPQIAHHLKPYNRTMTKPGNRIPKFGATKS